MKNRKIAKRRKDKFDSRQIKNHIQIPNLLPKITHRKNEMNEEKNGEDAGLFSHNF